MPAIPRLPGQQRAHATRVGEPVSGEHAEHWQSDYVFAAALPITCFSQYFAPTITGHTGVVYFTLKIPYGTHAAFVEYEHNIGSAFAASTDTTITVDGGTPTWIGPAPSPSTLSDAVQRVAPTYRHFFDVSAYQGSTLRVGVQWDDTDLINGTGAYGFRRISAGTVWLANTTPGNAGETGMHPASHRIGAPIVEGSAGSGKGLVELYSLAAYARQLGQCRHLQWAWYESTSLAETTTSTTLTALLLKQTQQPVFRMRARRIYTTATTDQYQLRVRHHITSGKTMTLRVSVTPVGGSVATTDHTFTGTGSWTAETSATAQSIATSGTDQECDVSFQWLVEDGSTTAYLSNLLLVENET